MYIPQNISVLNETVFKIEIITPDIERAENLGFRWNVTAFNEQYLILEIYFEYPPYISLDKTRDKLRVEILEPMYLET